MAESAKLLEHPAGEYEDAPRCLTSSEAAAGADLGADYATSSEGRLTGGKEDEQGDVCHSSQAGDESEQVAEMRRKAGKLGEAVQLVQDTKEQRGMKGGDLGAMPREPSSEELQEVTGECRICQEEDVVSNLDNPCSCAGSLKYAHSACLQHWCDEKRNTLCEICHKPYKSTYVAPEPRPQEQTSSSVLSIEIREEAGPDGTPSRVMTLRDTVTGEETRFDLSEPEEQQDPWMCLKLILLIFFILMLLPRALMLLLDMDEESDADANDSSVMLLRMVGLFLPLFILMRIVSSLHERHREREAAETEVSEAAAQVALLLHARHAQFLTRNPSGGVLPLSTASSPRPVAIGVV